MKINLTNTNYTIAISIAFALLLILSSATSILSIYLPQWGYYLSSLLTVACLSWIIVFVINLLKSTNEKQLIINAFIIYLIYSLVQYTAGNVLSIIQPNQQYMIGYSLVSTITGAIVAIYLTVMTFIVKHKDLKAPLRFLAICKLSIIVFNGFVPYLVVLLLQHFSSSHSFDFWRYLGLIYILIPIGGIYVGATVLNLLNSEQGLNTPNYKSDFEAQWPNDKPAL